MKWQVIRGMAELVEKSLKIIGGMTASEVYPYVYRFLPGLEQDFVTALQQIDTTKTFRVDVIIRIENEAIDANQ